MLPPIPPGDDCPGCGEIDIGGEISHDIGCPYTPVPVVDLDAPEKYPEHRDCKHDKTLRSVLKCERRSRPAPESEAGKHPRCQHPMTAYEVRKCKKRRKRRGRPVTGQRARQRSHGGCDHPTTPAARAECRAKTGQQE